MDERKRKQPNLFCFATKELSQDAMVCWLLSWANPEHKAEDPDLHACAVRFVNALRRKHGKPAIGVKAVEMRQQDCRIDVLIRVNGEHVVLIEDKISAGDNEAKLKRYYDCVSGGKTSFGPVARNEIYPTYLKTGNYQLAERQMVEKAGYKFFDRRDFLGVLKGYRGVNAILVDYRDHFQCWEDDTESYRNWQAGGSEQWSWRSWEGFYGCLEATLGGDAKWGYVPNPLGGFLSFLRGGSKLPGGAEAYLQLEVVPGGKRDLCFKIGIEAGKVQPDLARKLQKAIFDVGGDRVRKPKKLHLGGTMTVAVWSNEWISFGRNGKIDLKRTVENLREAEGVLQGAVRNF